MRGNDVLNVLHGAPIERMRENRLRILVLERVNAQLHLYRIGIKRNIHPQRYHRTFGRQVIGDDQPIPPLLQNPSFITQDEAQRGCGLKRRTAASICAIQSRLQYDFLFRSHGRSSTVRERDVERVLPRLGILSQHFSGALDGCIRIGKALRLGLRTCQFVVLIQIQHTIPFRRGDDVVQVSRIQRARLRVERIPNVRTHTITAVAV